MSKNEKCSITIAVLAVFGILVSIKMIFTGILPDEEYQLTMAYRFANGDDLFHYSWDTIQTSGFLSTLLTSLYLSFHNTDSIVIFQRICGICLQLLVSLIFYNYIKSLLKKNWAIVISFALFVFFPKVIASPEFANMLQWFTILMVITLGIASNIHKKHSILSYILLVISALFLCGAILSQACFILVPIMVISICLLFPEKKFITNLIFFATCFITGTAYILYFVAKIGLNGLISGLTNILNSDMTHASGANLLGQSVLISLIKNSFHVFYLMIIVFIASYVICILICKKNKTAFSWSLVKLPMIIISGIYTLYQWFILNTGYDGLKLFIPVCILFAFIDCITAFVKKYDGYRLFFVPFVGLLVSVGVFINVLLISNVPMINNLCFLSTGVIWSLVIFSQADCNTAQISITTNISVAFLTAIICAGTLFTLPSSPSGNNIFSCTTRINNGPAANIYTSEQTAHIYNQAFDDFTKNIPEKSNVLIVTNSNNNTLLNYCYLLNDVNISHYSVNSTPTFSQKLEEYWIQYPEKVPDVILINNSTYSTWEFDWIRIYTQYYWTYKNDISTEIFDIFYH